MRRWIATGLATVMLVTVASGLALAGSGGRKNTAIGLTGGAVYAWLNGGFKSAGRRNTALALTGASVVAWHKYKKAKRAERRRARMLRAYRYNGYRSSYYAQPVSYVRGYRSSYSGPARSGSVRRGSSHRYCAPGYRAGYRAGSSDDAGA